MRAKAPLFLVGLGALIAGFGLTRHFQGKGDSDVPAIGVTGILVPAASENEVDPRINPELLRELRRLSTARERRSLAALKASDFPDVLLRADEEDGYDSMDGLFRRWAELDEEGMVRYFLERGNVMLPTGPRSSSVWVEQFFKALIERDPRRAVEVAARFPPDSRYLPEALELVARESPELAITLALEHVGRLAQLFRIDLGKEANCALARALAEREPLGADELAALGRIYFADDPAAGVAVWASLSPEARARTATAFLPEMDDGSAAAGELFTVVSAQLEAGGTRDSEMSARFFRTFSRRMLETSGLSGSISWVETNMAANSKSNALSALFSQSLESGIPHETVFAAFNGLRPGRARDDVAAAFADAYFARDQNGALAWAAGLPPDAALDRAMERIAFRWVQSSVEAAEKAALSLAPGKAADLFMEQIASERFKQLGGLGGLEWAAELPDYRSRAAMEAAARAWLGEDAKAAYEYIAGMEGNSHRDVIFKSAVGRRIYSTDDRAAWMSGLRASDRELVREVIRGSGYRPEWQAEAMADLEGRR